MDVAVVQKAYNGLIKVLSEAPTVTLANAQPTEQQTAICLMLKMILSLQYAHTAQPTRRTAQPRS